MRQCSIEGRPPLHIAHVKLRRALTKRPGFNVLCDPFSHTIPTYAQGQIVLGWQWDT